MKIKSKYKRRLCETCKPINRRTNQINWAGLLELNYTNPLNVYNVLHEDTLWFC
jgi:hypothetical protein